MADIVTDELAVQMVREAVGEPDLEVHVEDVDKWSAVADVADTFQAGRVFLAGDAAHTMPPTGGFGGNTGIQDAHNLAWKLALVIKGQADPRLLETYDAERQPAGAQAVEQAYNRYVMRVRPRSRPGGRAGGHPRPARRVQPLPVAGRPPRRRRRRRRRPDINPRQSFGRPGTRAPHVVLERGDELISTLDLFGNGFVLLAGPDGGGWPEAARAASETAGVEVTAFVVERAGGSGQLVDHPDDGAAPFWTAYGVEPSGASLVRPDGYVGWRQAAHGPDAAERLVAALGAILGRSLEPAVAAPSSS